MLSLRLQVYRIDERRLFHLLIKLADIYILGGNTNSATQSQVLSNYLIVGIKILEQSESNGFEYAELCSSLMPKALHLSCSAISSVACPAASLCTTMMKEWARPSGWEEQLESFKFVEAFDSIIAELKVENNALSTNFHDLAARTKSLLLLISQIISDSRSHAEIIVTKGLCEVLVAICHVLADLLPATDDAGKYANTLHPADKHGRYLENGSRFEMHKVYCILLSLCSLLWTALPGHRKVQELLLRVSVIIADRMMLSLQVPGDSLISLGYAEEGRVTIAFICTLARLEGEWLRTQPSMMSQLRCMTARFLDYAAHGIDSSQIVAICPEEVDKYKKQFPKMKLSHALGLSSICIIQTDPENMAEIQSPTLLSFTIASQVYAMIKYALRFQLFSSPEICEAESKILSDRWVSGEVLQDLTTQVASSIVNILEQDKEITSASHHAIALSNILEVSVEVIENAEALMNIMSYNIPRQTKEEVQNILKRASLSVR